MPLVEFNEAQKGAEEKRTLVSGGAIKVGATLKTKGKLTNTSLFGKMKCPKSLRVGRTKGRLRVMDASTPPSEAFLFKLR